ncbi:MAG: PD-(D/E)XK nuclease family protein [Lachnospiraceae bacterium]|nr:PD-(D/E)XK nuclease family protein [Lachnospiraceae bacterium]
MLRFIYGASGAGKSTYLYNEIIRRAQDAPDGRFLILVPDQFTMQVQQEVVKLHPKHALMNIDVLSFSRLLHRVFAEAGYPKEVLLDDLGKTLILRHLSLRMKKELPVIAKGMHKAGYADEVKSTLSEFMQYDIAPEQLDALIEGAAKRPHLQQKLKDLQTIYRAFEEYVSGHFRTAEDTVLACAKRVADCRFLRDAVIVFDGFTGFTPVQYRLITELLQAASEVIVSVTIADAGASPKEVFAAANAGTGEEELFALSKQTIRQFTHCAYEAERAKETETNALPPYAAWAAYRVSVAEDVLLPEHPVARHKENEALSFLERQLFRHAGGRFPDETDAVYLRLMSTPAEEVRQTFRTIRRMLREDPALQYRDFAVICANPAEYAEELTRTAADFDIPVYEDRTDSLNVNPLMEYLRGVLETLRTNFAPVAVFHVLKSGMTKETREDTDLTENHVRATGVRGRKQWASRFTAPLKDGVNRTDEAKVLLEERIDGVCSRFYESMQPLLAAVDKKGTVRDILTALYTMLERQEAASKLSAIADRFAQAGDAAKELYYRQTFPKVVALFETVERLLGDEVLNVKEIADVLETGFANVTVGTLPQSADRVMTGDTERTRLKDVKVLFLLGAGDHAIPKRDAGTGFLSEADRMYLKEAAPDVTLAPTPSEQMYIQRLYLYMTLTKPTRALFLSCAAQSPDGSNLRPSFLMHSVQSLFAGMEITRPETDALQEQAESGKDMRHRMAALMRRYADGAMEEGERQTFLTLYRTLAASGEYRDRQIRRAAFYRYSPKNLPQALAETMFPQTGTRNVSELEQFAACAFAHFLKHGLGIRERATSEFDAADLGNVYHNVLERFARVLEEKKIAWTGVTDAEAEEILRNELEAYAKEHEAAHLAESVRGRMLQERIGRVLLRTVKTLRYHLQQGVFVPAGAEMGIVHEAVKDGKRVRLKGRIDRLELARDAEHTYLKILDFKSGKRDFDAAGLYYGVQLQLMLYMEAALQETKKREKGRDVVPAAMLYYQVRDPMINTEEDETVQEKILKELRPRGLVNADRSVIDLLEKDLSGISNVLPLGIKKDGSFRKGSDVFTGEEFDLLCKHTDRVITGMGEDIAAGNIAVSPARLGDWDACEHCAYRSVCGFDPGVPGFAFRELREMELADVIECIQEEE